MDMFLLYLLKATGSKNPLATLKYYRMQRFRMKLSYMAFIKRITVKELFYA